MCKGKSGLLARGYTFLFLISYSLFLNFIQHGLFFVPSGQILFIHQVILNMRYKLALLLCVLSVFTVCPVLAQTASELNNSGLTKYSAKDYAGAMQDFNKAIELNPKFDIAYHNRGLVKHAMKDFAGAIQDYTKAIEINPAYANAFNDRGLSKSRLKQYEEAKGDYSKAIELNPQYTSAYNNRAMLRSGMKDFAGAIQDYNKSIELKPAAPEGYIGRGLAKLNVKDTRGAIPDFDKAIELNPSSAVAFLYRGNARHSLKDDKGAVEDFNKVIALQPGNSNVYYNLGSIYVDQNKLPEAIRSYRQYSALEPAEWSGNKSIGDIYFALLKKYDSSVIYYERAYRLKKDDKELIERYGYSLLKLKRSSEAIAMFRNQVALLPNDPYGYYNLGAAYSVSHQSKEALEYLDKALDKRMTDLALWEADKNLDDVRILEEFSAIIKKYITKTELAKYPNLFKLGQRE